MTWDLDEDEEEERSLLEKAQISLVDHARLEGKRPLLRALGAIFCP